MTSLLFDRIGLIIAAVTFLFCWFLFTSDTSMAISSFVAAAITSALVWVSYVMIRWLVMSFRE